MTRNGLIKSALHRLNAIDALATPSADEITRGQDALNRLLKLWGGIGVTVWTRQLRDFALTSGTGTYTLGATGSIAAVARPLAMPHASLVYPDGSVRPLLTMTEAEHLDSAAAAAGLPRYFRYWPSRPDGTLYLLPIVNAAGYGVKYLGLESIAAITTDTAPDLPDEWEEPLVLGMAAMMGPAYGFKDSLALENQALTLAQALAPMGA